MAISIQDVEIVADGLDHPECVIYHPDGSLWAGGEAGRIYKISFAGKGGRSCNIAFGGEKFDALYVANLGRWHINRINLG